MIWNLGHKYASTSEKTFGSIVLLFRFSSASSRCFHFRTPTPDHLLLYLDSVRCCSFPHLKLCNFPVLSLVCFHHSLCPSTPSSPPPPALVSSITAHDSRSANMAFSSRFSFWEQKGSLVWTIYETLFCSAWCCSVLHCVNVHCLT